MNAPMKCSSLVLAAVLLAACGKKAAEAPSEAEAPPVVIEAQSSTKAESASRSTPDFGGVTKVSRDVEGFGSTPELAVLAALQSAVSQVNGVRVAGSLQSVRAGLSVTVDGQSERSASAEAFAQQIVAASQGSVLGYEILSQEEIDKVDEETIAKVRASDGGYSYSASGSASYDASYDAKARVSAGDASAAASQSASASYNESGEVSVERGASSYSSDTAHRKMRSYWKVRVQAHIAQYRAPDEQGRPKIVVAMPRTLSSSYSVGDGRVGAAEVAQAVRGRLSDLLTQTKRFIVLDREFGDELEAEIDHINSGNVRLQDAARIEQQLATDLLLIPTIERFEYPRHVRQLNMSDRKVVSYSGGGRITLRLINSTTGEVVMSDSFDHQLAATGPSTLPRVVDSKGMVAEMMNSLSGRMGTAIVAELFPVSVVAATGDQVVLSQGGDSLLVGQTWQAVYLGAELTDPQTGRSLGRSELPCCSIRIDRVSSQTSYGTIEDGASKIAADFRPGSIELRSLKPSASAARATAPVADAPKTARAERPRAAAPEPEPPAEDSNW